MLPASDKRLGPLRCFRGAALPGHALVVYDPDSALVCDIVACEDAYQSERIGAAQLIESAQAAQVWIGDRHFCTQPLLCGLQQRTAACIVREHTNHPRLRATGSWGEYSAIPTGRVRQQSIEPTTEEGATAPGWRRIEIELDAPTEAGDSTIALWSNLPEHIDAATIAQLYRRRWRIEGMLGRLESVLHSEVKTLGHPRAALLGFAVAVLAYNVLALLKEVTQRAHCATHPALDVSTYHLTVEIASTYEAMMLTLPAEHLPRADDDPGKMLQRLLLLACRLSPKQLASSKRAPRSSVPKGYVDAHVARSHVSTDRVLKAVAQRR